MYQPASSLGSSQSVTSFSIPEITALSTGEWACTWVPSASQHTCNHVKVCHSFVKCIIFTICFFFTLLRFDQGAGRITSVQQGRRNWGWPVSQNSIKLFVEFACLSSPSCFSIVIFYFSIFCLQVFLLLLDIASSHVRIPAPKAFLQFSETQLCCEQPHPIPPVTYYPPRWSEWPLSPYQPRWYRRFVSAWSAIIRSLLLKRFSCLHAMRKRLNRLQTGSKPHPEVVYPNRLRNRFSAFTRKRFSLKRFANRFKRCV